jgi:putative GTP pyrophosphokinase
VTPTLDVPTKSQIKKAGSVLRRAYTTVPWPDDLYDKVEPALDVLIAYRAAHAVPLAKANNGLRSMVKTEGCEVEVSQRLKRIPTIIDKLRREPTMGLETMADIGGCRAVLNSIDEIRRVEARVKHRRPPVNYHDYVTNPRSTGYRAVHLIVQYDGRKIEIQLRTRFMHEWAYTVERVSGKLNQDIKGGRGPIEVVDWFRAVSEAMALDESGMPVPATLLDEIARLRTAALPYVSGGRS